MTEKAQAELNARFIQGAITLLGRSDNGAWHRSIEVARRLVAYGIWDGEERIEFDAYLLHDKMFGVAQVSPLDLVAGKDYRFPDRRQPIKLGPKWPNQASRRTSRIGGQTRYEIAWFSPDGEALASLYVTKGKRLATGGILDGLKLAPDHARIEIVVGSVVADGEGDSARAAYRAADRDLRLFRQDPADLLRKLALAEQRAKRLQTVNDELRAHLAHLQAEQETLIRNFADLQRQAEQQATNSAALGGPARLDEARRPGSRGSRPMIRNGPVYVSHILRPRRVDEATFFAPLQRVRAGWVGRYVGQSATTHTIFQPNAGTTARRVVHLVEHPVTGRLHKVLAEDLTLVEERAQ